MFSDQNVEILTKAFCPIDNQTMDALLGNPVLWNPIWSPEFQNFEKKIKTFQNYNG